MRRMQNIPFWLKMLSAVAGAIVVVSTALSLIGGPLLSMLGGMTAQAAEIEHTTLHKRITKECDAAEIIQHVDKRFFELRTIIQEK